LKSRLRFPVSSSTVEEQVMRGVLSSLVELLLRHGYVIVLPVKQSFFIDPIRFLASPGFSASQGGSFRSAGNLPIT